MTAYASSDDFESQTAHLDLDTPDDVDGLLERASRDLDSYLCRPPLATPGLRIDTAMALTPFAADCLTRATILQSVYRLEVGEIDLVEGKPRLLSVGLLTFSRDAPDPVSPAALVALAGGGLLAHRTGTAPAPPQPPLI